jgi:myo-inositol 2-dehydrogenase/D-chiro-inositol 1-dehydrogenase
MRRFDPVFEQLRERIVNGEIGEPLTLQLASREHFPPDPDEDVSAKGGLLVDIAIHDFDVACWLLGDEPERCFASGATLRYPELSPKGDIDTALVVIEFRGGGRAAVHVSRAGELGLEISCDAYGSTGSLHVGATARDVGPMTFTAADRERFPADYQVRFAPAFEAELATFVRACRGEPVEVPDLDTDARAVAIAQAALCSVVSGCAEPIEVSAR